MKISIITVCRNSDKSLEQTIISVLNQTYKNIEYIIIDGASSDSTVSIINKYQNKLAYWISEPDKGIYDAMNKGIRKITGEYVYFLNSDDCFINNSVLSNITNILKENEHIEILSGTICLVDERVNMQKIHTNKVSEEEFLMGKMLPHQGIFIKAELMKQKKFNIKYHLAADYDFILQCFLERRKFMIINDCIAFFALGGAGNVNNERVVQELKMILSNYNIDPNKINEKIYPIESHYKNIVDFLLNKHIKFFIILKYFRGWKMHRCQNLHCRWCNKK